MSPKIFSSLSLPRAPPSPASLEPTTLPPLGSTSHPLSLYMKEMRVTRSLGGDEHFSACYLIGSLWVLSIFASLIIWFILLSVKECFECALILGIYILDQQMCNGLRLDMLIKVGKATLFLLFWLMSWWQRSIPCGVVFTCNHNANTRTYFLTFQCWSRPWFVFGVVGKCSLRKNWGFLSWAIIHISFIHISSVLHDLWWV